MTKMQATVQVMDWLNKGYKPMKPSFPLADSNAIPSEDRHWFAGQEMTGKEFYKAVSQRAMEKSKEFHAQWPAAREAELKSLMQWIEA